MVSCVLFNMTFAPHHHGDIHFNVHSNYLQPHSHSKTWGWCKIGSFFSRDQTLKVPLMPPPSPA